MPAPVVPHSFELYPPRSPAAAAALPGVVDELAASGPEWCSVTWGASGSTTEASYELVRLVHGRGDVDVMAHLTCVGTSRTEADALVRRFLDLGVRRFLAIRGDPVEGVEPGDLRSAVELVRLILEEPPVPGPPPEVAVAAFVNGHPESTFPTDHLDALLAKQAAGATLAITQLFFSADDYAAFTERARAWGVTIPIVPGIMPVTSPARLRRMLELSGEEEPADLAVALELEPTVEGRREVGVAHAVRFARDLIAAGAPALHLYTFNRSGPALEVLERLGMVVPATKETT